MSSPVHTKELNAAQLEIIRNTAAKICNTVTETKGQKSETQIAGDVKAQLGGLAGRLANVGLDGKVSDRREAFEGLSQEATGDALQGDRGCRERLFMKMFEVVAREPDNDVQQNGTSPRTRRDTPGAAIEAPGRSLAGEWVGSVICRDGRVFSLTLTLDKQSGDTASGTAVWGGANSGKSNVRLLPSPNAQGPSSYVYVSDRSSAYSYTLNKISNDKFVGQTIGSVKCDISLER
ncbi:hypothetical protein [Methylobacterium variabile]|jgi:hypothetical protein|uniref:hypothetical protein n=1 Tax=Methylobacterium variabile TaxID=298794 RepID=UPI0012EE6CD8|nr:hypothetical protein [Methylobacterium variabile]